MIGDSQFNHNSNQSIKVDKNIYFIILMNKFELDEYLNDFVLNNLTPKKLIKLKKI